MPMMAVGLVAIMAALGSAIDIGRIYMLKSQMQAGADAAALAGARAFAIDDNSPNDRDNQVVAYFTSNVPTNYLGIRDLTLDPAGAPTRFQTSNNLNLTTITAEAALPLMFMKLFGAADPVIRVVAKAEVQSKPLEVMMVLDDTGSMRTLLSNGKTRITALKEAANSFVSILYQGADARSDLALGFVMYDITANVGRLLQKWVPGSIATLNGFNDANTVTAMGSWPNNPLGWKGCVMNDSTIRDVNTDLTYFESGAWDLTRTLPGENGNPPVQPYFIPPFYVPKVTNYAGKASPTSDYYMLRDDALNRTDPGALGTAEAHNNLYLLNHPNGVTGSTALANTDAYRKYFYDFYSGLNNGSSTSGDDVIVNLSGGYFDTLNNNRDSLNYAVNYSRIPYLSDTRYWRPATTAIVNPDGGRVQDIRLDRTENPSPNWQCPEESVDVQYNRPRSFYTDIINNRNGAIYPGNGTLHHSGLLWGYRLLVRDDKFIRTRPTTEQPRRALVFMTDGENKITSKQADYYYDRTFTWYGQWLSTVANALGGTQPNSIASNYGGAEAESIRRFSKVCAKVKAEQNAPAIYIIALATNAPATLATFNQCAGAGHVYVTNDSSQLNNAFVDIAAELVDLHLVQ